MRPRRGRLTEIMTGLLIAAFAVSLGLALLRLSETEKLMRRNVGDNMLWAIAQGQVATLELDRAVARKAGLQGSAPELERHYDVLLSRLQLLSEGPQRRYMEALGDLEYLANQSRKVRALDTDIAPLDHGDRARAATIHEVLAPLARRLGRAANSSMVRHWNMTGARLDTEKAALFQVFVSVLAIMALGAFLCASMLRTMAREHRAKHALARAREINEAYRSFVALVSHQFRTPLAVIDSAMQRLLRRGAAASDADVADRAGRSRTEVRRLVRLIDTTLDSVRLEAGEVEVKPEACAIASLLEDARTRQIEATPSRDVRVAIADAVPARITTDPLLLAQIIDNLVSNAVKYSPASEPVTIRAGAQAGNVLISVEDCGRGIAPDDSDRLFQSFYRAEGTDNVPGAGLGLSIADQIACALGGGLDVESRQGLGATFTLTLPLGNGADGPRVEA